MRRALLPRLTVMGGSLVTAARCGHSGGPTHHDHSKIFTRPLSVEEQAVLDTQINHRTVSSITPGKLFMRHWTAAEQSTVSIVNRLLSMVVTLSIFIWACGYSTLGYNGLNAWHIVLLAFFCNWMVLHTHMLWLFPAMLAVVTLQVLFN